MLLSLVLLLTLGVLGWNSGVRDRAALAHESGPPPPAAPLAARAAPAEAPAMYPAPESAAVARAAQAVQALQAEQEALANAPPAAATGSAPKPDPRPMPGARSQRTVAPRLAHTPEPARAPGPEDRPPELAAATAAPVTAASPAPARPSVLCGDTQFLAHALCLQRTCDKPGMAGHPQCVRMHELQQSLRAAGSGG
ncbi:MAG TPA: hypothetical protein PKA16_04980 [Ottowia sp.]|uniref:hypothetical protein n=1 Tax=Ottowia sp. TaxID=1898956 RepID=UPI002B5A0046|nr:hypothetical protein [Ottowia sp.]HMN20727.1 hypothetical protein [Ottowia sp.]